MAEDGRSANPVIWWLAAAALAVALAVPFFLIDVPPVLDYPNHLARLYVLAFGGSDPVLSAMYAPHWAIIPNLGVDLVGLPLVHVLPLYLAGRILLYAAAIAPVAGVVCYHRAVFGRRSLWPLASVIVALNGIFFLGFINFLWSLGLAFAAAALWIAQIDRRPLVAVVAAALSGVALFFCHLVGVFLFALLIGAHEVARRWPRPSLRRVAVRGAMIAAALLPVLALYLLSPVDGASGPLIWGGPARKLMALFAPFATYDLLIARATMVAVLVGIVLVRRSSAVDRGSLIAAAALAAVFVITPSDIEGGSFIDVRVALMLACVLCAAFDPRLSHRAALAVAASVVGLLVVRIGDVAYVWQDHRRDLADLRATYAPVEAGAKVLVVDAIAEASPAYLAGEPPGRLVPGLFRMDKHWPALMLIERHAFWPLLFADPGQQPVVVRPAYAGIAESLGEPPDYRVLSEDRVSRVAAAPYLADWTRTFDYVLLLNAGAVDAAAVRPDQLDLVRQTDIAALYRIRQ